MDGHYQLYIPDLSYYHMSVSYYFNGYEDYSYQQNIEGGDIIEKDVYHQPKK